METRNVTEKQPDQRVKIYLWKKKVAQHVYMYVLLKEKANK